MRRADKIQEGLKPTRESFFGKLVGLFQRSKIEEELWNEMEELLIAADVGVGTTLNLIGRMKERVKRENISDPQDAKNILKGEIVRILMLGDASGHPLKSSINFSDSGPTVILVVGVNGSGKTTSIAKLAHALKEDRKKVILAAADTFRAAAIDQLKIWAERIRTEVISHQPGADPGAVVYDAIQAAKGRGTDVLIIDTAGRLQTKFNLMEELKKIQRVVARTYPEAPHEVLLVLDATTGQNGLSQAKYFTAAVGVTGIILAKLDGTAKGGIVIAICEQLKLPIIFVGTGERVEDMAPFNAEDFVETLFADKNN